MKKEFRQVEWDDALAGQWQRLLQCAVREDLDRFYDWTTVALVPDEAVGKASVVARSSGVIAGMEAARMTIAEFDQQAIFSPKVADADEVQPGQVVAEIEAGARNLLTAERTMLNVLSRLSGIASLTRRFVEATRGTRARIYDTRKTTAGWRTLEKYAVRAGGGWNHRCGLNEAVLIKDNHLALAASGNAGKAFSPPEAVIRARDFLSRFLPEESFQQAIVEVEVDSLEQLDSVLAVGPDIVLLDNFSIEMLRAAVERRDASAADVELEASGGIALETTAAVAATGVERISVGALTHSAPALNLALDWTAAP